MKLIREGIKLHIEALQDSGAAVPPPTSNSEVVNVRRITTRWSKRAASSFGEVAGMSKLSIKCLRSTAAMPRVAQRGR